MKFVESIRSCCRRRCGHAHAVLAAFAFVWIGMPHSGSANEIFQITANSTAESDVRIEGDTATCGEATSIINAEHAMELA